MTDWFCSYACGGVAWWLLPIHAIGGLVLGFVWGQRAERNRWWLRADGSTPHHVDGEFFYIVSERRYCEALCEGRPITEVR